MRIRVSDQAVRIEQSEVLTELAVSTSLDPGTAVQRLIAEGIAVAGGDATHVWLVVSVLKERAMPPATPSWVASYDAMIAYAESQGWVSSDGTLVRAHLEPA